MSISGGEIQESWECIFNMTTQLNYYSKNASRNLKNKSQEALFQEKQYHIIQKTLSNKVIAS